MIAAPAAAADRDDDPPICADRPAKGNGVCTVPPGSFQVETGLADWAVTEAAGVRTELLLFGSTFAKLGLSGRSDLQIGFTPLVQLDVTENGQRTRISGFGDVVVRYKQRLSPDDARVQFGVIPFIKLPTARSGIGNGQVEGGLAVPVSFSFGKASMTLGPEADLLADADGHGRHAALINLVNISTPVAPRLTATVELWSNLNFDPAGTVRQASADAALAYAVSNRMQLDAGANVGLTRDTADLEAYAGTSVRF
jgi:hypothetical protein